VTTTITVADFAELAVLVAQTLSVPVPLLTWGAVYRPVLEIVPWEADHVKPWFEELLTFALNCTVCPATRVGAVGETVTLMVPVVATRIEKLACPWFEVASVTVTFTAYVPAVNGTPVMLPVVRLRVKPAGRPLQENE